MVAEPSRAEVRPHTSTSNHDLQLPQAAAPPPLHGSLPSPESSRASSPITNTSSREGEDIQSGINQVEGRRAGVGTEESSTPQMTTTITPSHPTEVCSTPGDGGEATTTTAAASGGNDGVREGEGATPCLPDLSEFERVWENSSLRPASLASSETLTPESLPALTPATSPAHQPSAFTQTQDSSPQREEVVLGAVGGGGRACGCGVGGGVEDDSGRCPGCPRPAPVYVSEQFPPSDPLECVDGSSHTLHVDLSTGEVQLHLHLATDPNKPPRTTTTTTTTTTAPSQSHMSKCLGDPQPPSLLPPAPAPAPSAPAPSAPTTSTDPDPTPPKQTTISF
ncbi:hypothetical protein Pmani_017068, partial [Petrolisthes manimaculis]